VTNRRHFHRLAVAHTLPSGVGNPTVVVLLIKGACFLLTTSSAEHCATDDDEQMLIPSTTGSPVLLSLGGLVDEAPSRPYSRLQVGKVLRISGLVDENGVVPPTFRSYFSTP
jgi:hypothetical protein